MSYDLLGDIYGDVPRADPTRLGLVVERTELVVHGELAQLLDALELFVRRYVVLDEAQAAAVTLWVAHTWAIDAAFATPYLFVTAPSPNRARPGCSRCCRSSPASRSRP